MKAIPKWAYSVGFRLFVALWLIYGTVLIWQRFQTIGRPVSRIDWNAARLASLSQAIQTYALDNGAPPTTAQGLDALVRPPSQAPQAPDWDGPYLIDTRSIASDEWGRPFLYLSPGPTGEPFVVMTYGKDGKPGGVGEDADITRP